MKALNAHGTLSRKEIEELLFYKLPDSLTAEMKSNRVENLLRKLREAGEIRNIRQGQKSTWIIAKD